MDQIKIRRLEVFANHGVLPEENKLGQKFLISAALYCDTRKAGQSDAMADSISYAAVSHLIRDCAQKQVFHLLERLAEFLAERLLLEYPQLKKVELEIEKPWAPIQLPLETVSVKIERGWNIVYLGIGSNLGDKENNLSQAIELLGEDSKIQIFAKSQFYVTAPVGYVKQDDFLNGAIGIRTLYSPQELLSVIGNVEAALKRERLVHWGPRTIDLDILLYNDQIIQQENLTIPHIEMTDRMFVLRPLCDIAPYALHPVEGKTVRQLLQELEHRGGKDE